MGLSLRKKISARVGLVLLAFIAFIALGMPDGLLGVGWPSIRTSFDVPLDSLGMLLIAGTTGYLISSFSSGYLISRLGVGGVLVASCALTGAGLIGYTLVPEWWMMVALGTVAGLGAGAIDAGLNTYIAANFGEGLMQWLHASYGIGVTLGPIIMTTAINTFTSWRLGYHVVGFFQLALATCFIFTLPMWKQKPAAAQAAEQKLTDYKTPFSQTLRQPRVWLSVSLFFLYAGSEVALGSWAYTLLSESRSIPSATAGLVAGSYWFMFTVGRFLAGLYTRRFNSNTLIRAGLLGALSGAALLWWNPSALVSLVGVALIGFSIAPIFPALVSATSQRVSPQHAANTIGMQISVGGLGSALIPGLVGVLARHISLEVIPACLFSLFALQIGLHTLAMKKSDPARAKNSPA